MARFEKVEGYNAIQDNEVLEYTLAEYEPKTYSVGEFDVTDMLNLLNGMNDEICALRNEIAHIKGAKKIQDLCEVRNNFDLCNKCGFCNKGDE